MNLNIKKRKNIVMNISEYNENKTMQREKEKKINLPKEVIKTNKDNIFIHNNSRQQKTKCSLYIKKYPSRDNIDINSTMNLDDPSIKVQPSTPIISKVISLSKNHKTTNVTSSSIYSQDDCSNMIYKRKQSKDSSKKIPFAPYKQMASFVRLSFKKPDKEVKPKQEISSISFSINGNNTSELTNQTYTIEDDKPKIKNKGKCVKSTTQIPEISRLSTNRTDSVNDSFKGVIKTKLVENTKNNNSNLTNDQLLLLVKSNIERVKTIHDQNQSRYSLNSHNDSKQLISETMNKLLPEKEKTFIPFNQTLNITKSCITDFSYQDSSRYSKEDISLSMLNKRKQKHKQKIINNYNQLNIHRKDISNLSKEHKDKKYSLIYDYAKISQELNKDPYKIKEIPSNDLHRKFNSDNCHKLFNTQNIIENEKGIDTYITSK